MKLLKREARKYKTAEEFVESKETYYHGSESKKTAETEFNTGIIYLSKDKVHASEFGKNITEYIAQPKKVYDFEKDGVDGYYTDENGKQILDEDGELISIGFLDANPDVVENLVNRGFDSAKDNDFFVTFDPANIKTKSQLTDIYKKATAKVEKPAVQKELKLLVKEVEIREWQDIPELDAQIRTIKEPDPKDKDDIFWTVKIGLQESLGEQGGDIITEFYKGKPTLKDIKRDVINTYKEKKIEINKEVAIGITAKSGRDEMIERVIDKILGRQTLTR